MREIQKIVIVDERIREVLWAKRKILEKCLVCRGVEIRNMDIREAVRKISASIA
jgi:hypothetical protein